MVWRCFVAPGDCPGTVPPGRAAPGRSALSQDCPRNVPGRGCERICFLFFSEGPTSGALRSGWPCWSPLSESVHACLCLTAMASERLCIACGCFCNAKRLSQVFMMGRLQHFSFFVSNIVLGYKFKGNGKELLCWPLRFDRALLLS